MYDIMNEAEKRDFSKVAVSLGAPKIYERVNDERGRGIIMEYVTGQSMLEYGVGELNASVIAACKR